MAQQVLLIRIELIGAEPAIWRRIQIKEECTFWELHVAIQNAMGWTDSHLHSFRIEDAATGQRRMIGLPFEGDFDDEQVEPGWEHQVTDHLSIQRARILYEYDYGDSWEHAVVLEDILPIDDRAEYPRCISGKRACPPEDVGGVRGYESFLVALADPDDSEHDEFLTWVGGSFDPELFDPDTVTFEDPKVRWQVVFGQDPGATGQTATGVPQIEGGFTPDEIQRLLLSPFDDDAPMQVVTDLPDDAFEAAPLVRDIRRYLQVMANEGSLKLTQKGNLSRAAITLLIKADALGAPWWREDRPARNEADMPQATLLRGTAELAGLTRKRKGKLYLTKRGQAVVEGRLPSGELFGMLLQQYATRYNWAYEDAMPASQWVQSFFWYALYLLQQYGEEPRSSNFYAERYLLGLPFVLQDFTGSYSEPTDLFFSAFEVRVIRNFAVRFGLAATEPGDEEWTTEPCQVRAGPLLYRVITWQRDPVPENTGSGDDGSVVAGPWAQDPIDADAPKPEDMLGPRIVEVLEGFLMAQRQRLRSQQSIRDYEQVIALLQVHLDAVGPDMLSAEERTVWGYLKEDGGPQHTFCEIFGPEWIPGCLEGFLSFFLIRKVAASAQVSKAAGAVCKKLLTWLEAEDLLDGVEDVEDPTATGRDLTAAQEAATLLAQASARFEDRVVDLPEEDYLEFSHHTIAKVEAGRLWLEVYEAAKPVVIGPLAAPKEATKRLRAGWEIACGLGRIAGKWRLVEVANVYPS